MAQAEIDAGSRAPEARLPISGKLCPRLLRHFHIRGKCLEHALECGDRRKDVQVDVVGGSWLFGTPRECQRSSERVGNLVSRKGFVQPQYQINKIDGGLASGHSLL